MLYPSKTVLDYFSKFLSYNTDLSIQYGGINKLGHGTCFPTCLACIFEVEASTMPLMVGQKAEQLEAVQKWVNARQTKAIVLPVSKKGDVKHVKGIDAARRKCILIGRCTGKTKGYHAVVGRYQRAFGSGLFTYLHDPIRGGLFLEAPLWAIFFVPEKYF